MQNNQIRFVRLREEYSRFSKATGLPLQHDRMEAAGFTWKHGKAAQRYAEDYYKYWSKSIGANESVKTLADYYEMKYNRPEEYRLLKKYASSVDSGHMSPMAKFETYKQYHSMIQQELIGKTINGVTVTGQSQHFLERVFGCMMDPKTGKPRNGTSIEDVLDCLNNPVDFLPAKTSQNGERSFVVVGHRAKVSINPDTGVLVQTNPWRC